MKNFRMCATILAVVFSVAFALLLFPEIVGVHGVVKSIFVIGLGIGVIWLFYFLLGRLFGRIYAAGSRGRGRKQLGLRLSQAHGQRE